MVDTAWVVRVHDFDCFALAFLSMSAVYFGHAEALGDLGALNNAVTVDSHCSNVDQVALGVVFHHGKEHVESRLGVVSVGLSDCGQILH